MKQYLQSKQNKKRKSWQQVGERMPNAYEGRKNMKHVTEESIDSNKYNERTKCH